MNVQLTCWILALAVTPSTFSQQTEQKALTSSAQPTFQAGADLVLLDLIVRDKKGRTVRDLAPNDIEVFDNGVKVDFKGLRLVADNGDAAIVGTTTSASPRPAMDPLRQLKLVTLVFERLGTDGRVFARQAALDILKTHERANVYYAVFIIDERLKLLQPYTNDRQALKRAIEHATSGAYTDFTTESDQLQAQLQKQVGGPDGRSLQEQVVDATGGGGATGPAAGAAAAAGSANAIFLQMQLDMLQLSQEMSREQMGRASIFSLLSLVRGQSSLPGRKSVLYFTEGLFVPRSMEELFQSVISAANRNNVTFYAADIRGLRTSGDNAGIAELRAAAASSARSSRSDPTRPAPVTRDQVTAQDRAAEAINMNGQNAMAELAENTGGFLIANTNDFRIPLRKVDEDVNSYYELNYAPGRVEYDGKFRKIEVRALRPGLVIQSRSGYFALPPSEVTRSALLQPFEVPLLKMLGAGIMPHDVEFRARTLRIRPYEGTKVEGALVVEIPLSGIQFQPDDLSGMYRGQVGILALLRDAKGEIVRKIARDVPFESRPEEVQKVRSGNFVFKEAFAVPPGRYTVEVAVLDRKAEKAAARKSVFLAAAAPDRLSVSALMRVRNYAPHAPDLEVLDPFQFEGGRITPTLDETLHTSQTQTVGLFCVVSPDPQNQEKPTLTLEYLQDDKLVGRGDFDLPKPDSQGRIPWALFTPVASLKPGSYEVRAIVHQGQKAVIERTLLNVEP
jgi:VWFA-related protein